MAAIGEPTVTLDILRAGEVVGIQGQRVLIVGQMLTGTATPGDLYQNIPNDSSEDDLFGAGSHIAGMIRTFKQLNKVCQLDALPLADSGVATPAEADIVFSGTSATAAGSYTVTVGSEKLYSADIPVLKDDTPSDIATALATAMTGFPKVPFTSTYAAPDAVDFIARNGGTLGNTWDIKVAGTVPGIDYTITGWQNGTSDPTLTDVLDVIENIRYQTIVWPSSYLYSAVRDVLDARFNVANGIMDGVAIQVQRDSLEDVKTYVTGINSQSMAIVWDKEVDTSQHIGGATVEMPDIIASQMAAIRALRLTEGASIGRYMSTVVPLDQYGGMAIANLPYYNTRLPELPVASPVDTPTMIELEDAVGNGVSVFGPNRAGNQTIFGEMVTTYLTDGGGNPDSSYKYLNTVDSISAIREYFFNNFRTRYAQTRLTDGDLIPGRDIANVPSIKAYANELYDYLADMTLLQAGLAAKRDFNQYLVITTDLATGTASVSMAPLLVTQLRAIIGTITIKFGA